MRVVLSGSTGFWGSHLRSALKGRGADVHCVSALAPAAGVEHLDLTRAHVWIDLLKRHEPDAVLHLAGVVFAQNQSEFVVGNTLAAAALLDAALALRERAPTVLLIGSAAEYGPVPAADLPVKEEFHCAPLTPYGITKLAQTELGLAAARAGAKVVVTRPSNLIGPGAPPTSAVGSFSRQLRAIELGTSPPLLKTGNLETLRDFVDVRDASEMVLDLLRCPGALGCVVNVSAGYSVSMKSILEQLIRAYGLDVTIQVEDERSRPTVAAFSASRERLVSLVGDRPRLTLETTLDDIVRFERQTA